MPNPAVTGMIVSLGAMGIARKLPLQDPEYLPLLRGAYIGMQLLVLAVYYFCTIKIKQKNDTKTLKYVEPKQPGSQDPAKLVTTTVRDYDLAETSKAIRSVLIGIAMTGGMHVYFKYTQPLFIQSIMAIKQLYDAKIVQLHILNQPATGELSRPFRAAAMFGAAMGGPSTDAAQIRELENKPKLSKDE